MTSNLTQSAPDAAKRKPAAMKDAPLHHISHSQVVTRFSIGESLHEAKRWKSPVYEFNPLHRIGVKGAEAEGGNDEYHAARFLIYKQLLGTVCRENHFCYALKYGNDVCEFPACLIKKGLQWGVWRGRHIFTVGLFQWLILPLDL